MPLPDLSRSGAAGAVLLAYMPWIVAGVSALAAGLALWCRYRVGARDRLWLAASAYPALALAYLLLAGGMPFEQRPVPFLLGLLYLQGGVLLLDRRLVRNRLLETGDPYTTCLHYASSHPNPGFECLFYPIPFLPYRVWLSLRRLALRRAPRTLIDGTPLRRLRGKAADPYLNEGQRLEIRMGSAEYDIWVTAAGAAGKVECYPNRSMPFRRCPRCEYRTCFLRRLDRLRRSGAGRVRRLYVCRYCDHWVEVYEDLSPDVRGHRASAARKRYKDRDRYDDTEDDTPDPDTSGYASGDSFASDCRDDGGSSDD